MHTGIYSSLATITLPLAFPIHAFFFSIGGGENAFELSYCRVLSHTSSHFI